MSCSARQGEFTNLTPADLNGTNGFAISGIAGGDQTGQPVSTAGDFNNDGFDDLLIGAPGFGTGDVGAAYLVFGKATPFASTLSLGTSLNGTDAIQFSGGLASDFIGATLSEAGDINGDGIDDIVLGAFRANTTNGVDSGASYVIFGTSATLSGTFDVTTLSGSNGFRIVGASSSDEQGYAVSSAGDFNADGFDDLIVSSVSSDANGNNSGAIYLILGRAGGFSANLNLANFCAQRWLQDHGLRHWSTVRAVCLISRRFQQ